jgi:LmbE family N-acetylglucosaminyl deacetylase
MRVLAIGAHPDDIEYGCGGTLYKARKTGHEVYLFVVTDGSQSGDPEGRKKEQEKAAKYLGAEQLIWGGYSDTELAVTRHLINHIDNVIKDVKPELILVNYPEDTHQDHRVTAECTITAARYIRNVLFYEDFTSLNFQPDIFVDIKEYTLHKLQLMRRHVSQVEKEYPYEFDILESIKAIAPFRGFQGKLKYAEGFKALRYEVKF